MHEMSIALNIIDIAGTEAKKNNAGKISMVELDIGQLAGIEIDSLNFSFNTAKKNTPLENASLKINLLKAEALCRDCSCLFKLDDFIGTCPKCGKYDLEIIRGQELRVKSINIE